VAALVRLVAPAGPRDLGLPIDGLGEFQVLVCKIPPPIRSENRQCRQKGLARLNTLAEMCKKAGGVSDRRFVALVGCLADKV